MRYARAHKGGGDAPGRSARKLNSKTPLENQTRLSLAAGSRCRGGTLTSFSQPAKVHVPMVSNLVLAKMDISIRPDNTITLRLILSIGVMAAVAMALAFEVPLREWLSSSAVACAISLVAGVLVGAFVGLYTAKRIVERLAHR